MTSNRGEEHVHGPHVFNILRPWVDKPAGLFHKAFDSMTMFTDISQAEDTMSDADRKSFMKGFTLTCAYITSAKNCLTKEV